MSMELSGKDQSRNVIGKRRADSPFKHISRFPLFLCALIGLSLQSITAFAADTIAPSTPTDLAVSVVSNTQLNISWTASTDNVAVTAYLLERCKGTGCTTFAQIASLTGTSYTNTALTVSSDYSYRVRARDAANNRSAYSTVVTATTPPDTAAPSIPSGLVVTALSNTQLSLAWTPSTDDVKTTGYLVERCLTSSCTYAQVSAPTTTTYTNSALVPNTSYNYRVRAKDASGNISDYSTVVTGTTLPDTQAPTAPTSATATVVSNTSIKVTWAASTDDVKVTGYKIERCGGVGCTNFVQVATSTGLAYTNSGLLQGSSYSYRIRANDATGNLSNYSNVATTTTTGTDTQAPTAPTGLTATPSGTQVNLTWTASTDNNAVASYQIERCQGSTCTTFAQVWTSTSTSFNDTALSSNTAYRYRVRAVDTSNLVSSYSLIANGTTSAGVVECD